jgi:hypothetical protein
VAPVIGKDLGLEFAKKSIDWDGKTPLEEQHFAVSGCGNTVAVIKKGKMAFLFPVVPGQPLEVDRSKPDSATTWGFDPSEGCKCSTCWASMHWRHTKVSLPGHR